MLKAKLVSSYRKKESGNVVFRYAVSGNPEDIKAYEEAVGDNLKTDDQTGQPLYFTTRYVSDNIKLLITSEGNVVTDDTELTKMQSLVNQYGIEVAKLILMSKPSNSAE